MQKREESIMQPDNIEKNVFDKVGAPDRRANILGVAVDAVDMDGAVAKIASYVMTQTKGYVCLGGVHGIVEAQKNGSLHLAYEKAIMVAPDGMPTVWVGRFQGLPSIRRVFGPDLMIEVIRRSEMRNYSHFLCGGDYGVAEELRNHLIMRYPAARIVGTYTPPFRTMTKIEEDEFIDQVTQIRPDIIWVGLSTPKQELFMARYLPLLSSGVMIGVGAAFLYHTGRLRDSPQWVKQAGLQWLDRLIQEPQRLWKRYLVGNPKFIALLAMQLAGLRHYSLPNPPSEGE